jgi:hypothetical protein
MTHGIPIRHIAAAIALALNAAGCSAMSESTALANPGKFDLYTCNDIETTAKATRAQEQELRDLMVRAERGPAGGMVSAMAYRTDHMRARADLKLLADAAARKNCRSDSLWASERSVF